MNARPPADLARHAILTIRGARHASAAPNPRTIPPESHGRQIFVYNHLQKNHVVYSLTRSLDNHKSLSQLPFNGKNTVPRALRKDLWAPFATLTFPSGPTGLSVYQKLRELRRRHELEWTPYTLQTDEESPERKEKTKWFSKKQIGKWEKHELSKRRAKALCDQRANSVADMAYVLGRLEGGDVVEERHRKAADALAETRKAEGWVEKKIVKERERMENERAKAEERHGFGNLGLIGERAGVEVLVEWSNIVDAEFAETWSGNVVHGVLTKTKNRIEEIVEVAEQGEGGKEKEKIAA